MSKPISISNYDELETLLKINSPSSFKASNEKTTANFKVYSSFIALSHCRFINFNSKARISFMVFDIDKYGGRTALDYFGNIEGLREYILEKMGLEPTYILQTDKGFHFAYHLKNHVFTHQKKAVDYLRAIKVSITKLLGCDENGSHRINGVWRNPLLHEHFYSGAIDYKLSDFKQFLSKRQKRDNRAKKIKFKIDEAMLIEGNRNNALFIYALKFAKGCSSLTVEQLIEFIENVNGKCKEPLSSSEITTIARSVYGYWEAGTIRVGSLAQTNRNIDEGAMEFPKIAGLSYDEYEIEVKRRQKLSAIRTNEIKNQEQAKNQLDEARVKSAHKRQEANQKKVFDAIAHLENQGLKVNISSIAKIAGVDRRTAKKYTE